MNGSRITLRLPFKVPSDWTQIAAWAFSLPPPLLICILVARDPNGWLHRSRVLNLSALRAIERDQIHCDAHRNEQDPSTAEPSSGNFFFRRAWRAEIGTVYVGLALD